MGQRATREEVLAWMFQHDRGTKAASSHFGLPLGTVKHWRRWAQQTEWTPSDALLVAIGPPLDPPGVQIGPPSSPPLAPPVGPPHPSTVRAPSPRAGPRPRGDQGGSPHRGGRGIKTEDDPPGGESDPRPAPEVAPTADLPGPATGTFSPQAPSARDLPAGDRELLRLAVRRQLRRLAEEGNPYEQQAAAVVLKILLGAYPDILAFDEATAPPEERGDDPGDEAEALAVALRLKR